MASRDDRERDRTEAEHDDSAEQTAGGILGITRVPVGGAGEIRSQRGSADTADDGRVTALEDEKELGARDVTHGGHGETGPETGGHGSTPQRSGATGTDIGG